jgi:hypothetical protein
VRNATVFSWYRSDSKSGQEESENKSSIRKSDINTNECTVLTTVHVPEVRTTNVHIHFYVHAVRVEQRSNWAIPNER